MMASSDHLKPGEKGIIKVKVDTRLKSGPVYRTVQVETNSRENPLTILSIIMVVDAPLGPTQPRGGTR